MPTTTLALPTRAAVTPVAVAPGGAIVLRGQLTSSAHALVLDACQTGTADGATDGARGLIDYAAGGWQLQARDWAAHTCRLVATGGAAPACAAAGVAAPCLPSRLRVIANQLPIPTTAEEFRQGLLGGIHVEVLHPAEAAALAPPPPPSWAERHAAGLTGAALLLAAAVLGARTALRRSRTPEALVRRHAARVRARLRRGAPVYQRLAPLVDGLGRQAGELAALRDRLRQRVRAADRPALERRRDALAARGEAEAAEARAFVEEQLRRADRWHDESERAAARLDRVLEYLRALEARLDDEAEVPGGRTGVRVADDAQLLREIERDVEAALAGAREADRLVSSLRADSVRGA